MIVCIPATMGHRDIVKVSIDRLKVFMPDTSILIVCPEPGDYAAFTEPGVSVAADRDYSLIDKTGVHNLLAPSKRAAARWYYQQLLKFAVVSALEVEDVLVLDADTVLLKDLRLRPTPFYTTNEVNDPYFDHYHRLTGRQRTLSKSAVANFMFFEPATMRKMLIDIEERHSMEWWRAIITIANDIPSITAFSEYETYANWYSSANPAYLSPALRIFRRGDLLVKTANDFNRVCATAGRRGYEAIAFEMQHQSNLQRRIMARIVMTFGLSPW